MPKVAAHMCRACLEGRHTAQSQAKGVFLQGTLAMMHSKGVTHADIKPENILLTSPPGKPMCAPACIIPCPAYKLMQTSSQAKPH